MLTLLRMCKSILPSAYLSYDEDRLKKLKLPSRPKLSLSYRRVRGDMIEVFKITHDFYDPQVTNSLFQLVDSVRPTRSKDYKLAKVTTCTNTSAFQYFFTNRVLRSSE